jgi:DNA polymerase-3 subunit gamma/tau
MRDALTLLDRLISGLGTKIGEREAAEILDWVDRRVLWRIVDAVLAREPGAALDAVRAAQALGIEPARLVGELLEELRNLVVAALVDDPAELIDAAPEEVAEISARAKQSDAETLQRLFRVLVARAQELAWTPRPAESVELAVVRLATLPAAESVAALLERIDALERGGGGPAPRGGAPPGGGGSGPRWTPPRERSAPPPSAAPAPGPVERQAQLRQQVKAHPAVQSAIEVLDAELKEIRLREDPA